MSYLRPPRLVFAGRFQADTATINNDPEHYNTARFRSSYQLVGTEESPNGWWNPKGSGAWRFYGCVVQSVWYSDGSSATTAADDPVVGAAINGAERRVEGKLVDLDPEMQSVSQIWGFGINLDVNNPRYTDAAGFAGDFCVTAFQDMFLRSVVPPGFNPNSNYASAVYQSVLNNLRWDLGPDNPLLEKSRFLQELTNSGSALPEQLSIRFNVDGHNNTPDTDWFTFGRVVGSIGLQDKGTPKHFVPGRRLNPTEGSTLGWAVAELRGNSLAIDLGNTMPTNSPGGALTDLGALDLVARIRGGRLVTLGSLDYQSSDDWYAQTGGVQTLALNRNQMRAAATGSLLIMQESSPGPVALMEESRGNLWIKADQFVFRLQAGSKENKAGVTIRAMRSGRPLPNYTIKPADFEAFMKGQVTQGPIPGPPAGVPKGVVTWRPVGGKVGDPLKTNSQGIAELEVLVSDPGNPRNYIDGQVYGIRYGQGAPDSPSDTLNLLVWDAYEVPDTPTWLDDVQPIFQQYANMYPVMRPIVDLGNYASVISRLSILQRVFDAKPTDPNYMPVTRDLSPNKARMIKKWLRNPEYMRCSTVDELMKALQLAVELEHATLPPYLTALYSIKDGCNVEVAQIIRSVVIEEMLHMGLAANMLISIGGHPQINKAGFVPTYPGPLPGGLRGNLIVHLRKCSIAQIRDVFMSIEEPEETRQEHNGGVDGDDPIERNPFTIGWLYDRILEALEELDAAGKITWGQGTAVEGRIGRHKLYAIAGLADAQRAITEIKHQGEGSSTINPDEGADQALSHYYKFSEIVHGRRIVIENDGFSYSGEVIPFDEAGVYPMVDDPNTDSLDPDSMLYALSDQFNLSYQHLLNALHDTFNGKPNSLDESVGLMYSLKVQATKLMESPLTKDDDKTVGTSFEMPELRSLTES